MRLDILTFAPLALLQPVLAHAHAIPHHHQLARYDDQDRPPPLQYRHVFERQKTSTESNDDGLLGGLIGGSETITSKASTAAPAKSAVTSSLPVSSKTSDIATTPPISSPMPSAEPTSVISSIASASGGVSSAATNGTVLVSSIGVDASMAASVSSAAAASSAAESAASAAASSTPVTTVTTDASGQTAVITLVLTQTPSDKATPSASSAATKSGKSEGDSISTGAVIGISVGVGVVVLSLIGCAIWRMKRRNGDEGEAIRWPELNRHGDTTVHHALPARQTGQHGFETNLLERSASNSSSIFAPSTVPPHSATPMALNGSNFGATSSLEDYDYNEKDVPPVPGLDPTSPAYGQVALPRLAHSGPPLYDHGEDYTNMPPQVQMQRNVSGLAYEADTDDGNHGSLDPQMSVIGGGATAMPNPHSPYYGNSLGR